MIAGADKERDIISLAGSSSRQAENKTRKDTRKQSEVVESSSRGMLSFITAEDVTRAFCGAFTQLKYIIRHDPQLKALSCFQLCFLTHNLRRK